MSENARRRIMSLWIDKLQNINRFGEVNRAGLTMRRKSIETEIQLLALFWDI